jgi:glycosyltransferase involved in cell wall biosynthesis
MTPPPRITIGIPSYNRKNALLDVLTRLDRAFTPAHRERIDVLVIDDDSPDGAFDAARALPFAAESGWLHVQKNTERAGFCGNFFNLIRQCRSDYLLVSTDDDWLNADEVLRLARYLGEADTPPAWVTTLFRAPDGSVYRGREDVARIEVHEYRNCCNHLPGITLNTAWAQRLLPLIEPVANSRDNVYPQACFSLALLLQGAPCIYHPAEPVRTGHDLPSGIAGYSTLESRWRQFRFFDQYIGALQALSTAEAFQQARAQIHQFHRQQLFRTLGNGLSEERPDLLQHFLDGARQFLAHPG